MKLSALYGVTTDYLLQDEPPASAPAAAPASAPASRTVSRDEARSYLDCVRRLRGRIALGVALCILSPTPLIALAGFADEAVPPLLSEDLAGGMGVVALLVLVALGLLLLIPGAFALQPYQSSRKPRSRSCRTRDASPRTRRQPPCRCSGAASPAA